MKSFLRKIILFASPLVVLAWPLDILLSNLLKKSNAYPGELEVMNAIYQKQAACQLAVYGSSRAWVQIDPDILEDSLQLSAYNFGMDGHNFWLQYFRHRELVKYNGRPQVIVLSVDVFSLEKRKDLYKAEQFLPWLLWNKDIKQFTESYKGFTASDYYVPLVRYAGRTSALNDCIKVLLWGKSMKPYRHKGFAAFDRPWNDDLAKAMRTASNYTVRLDSSSIELMKQFIHECRQYNTALIFICTPQYVAGQEYISNRTEVMNLFRDMASENHIPFLDYSTHEICNHQELFYNSNHLNKKGSAIFTRMLAHDLKIILENKLQQGRE
jgi:hypothetical protein